MSHVTGIIVNIREGLRVWPLGPCVQQTLAGVRVRDEIPVVRARSREWEAGPAKYD